MNGDGQQERDRLELDTSEERHEPVGSARARQWYVLILVCFPFFLLLGTLVWLSTAEYQRHAQYPSFVGIGYGSRLHGADCEILVDGDSSALTGVEPAILQQRTGLKTCNIAEVAGVKMINGFMELDDYLAQNRPPRYLVFMFVPENLTDPVRWREVASFEGWFYRLRYHRDQQLLRMMWHDPEGVMITAELGLRTGLQWLPKHTLPPELAQVRERSAGRLPEPGTPLKVCRGPISMRAPDPDWLQSLRRRYNKAGMHVLIDVTPEPSCDPSFSYYRERTGNGITDNTLGTLPLGDYTDTGRLHTFTAGSQQISERIADQLVLLMGARAQAGVQ